MAAGIKLDITDEQIAKLLATKRGNVAAVARALRCSRTVVHERIVASAELAAIRDAAREATTDDIEQALEDKALGGDVTAQIFYLKTRGRKRGYVEKIEAELSGTLLILDR